MDVLNHAVVFFNTSRKCGLHRVAGTHQLITTSNVHPLSGWRFLSIIRGPRGSRLMRCFLFSLSGALPPLPPPPCAGHIVDKYQRRLNLFWKMPILTQFDEEMPPTLPRSLWMAAAISSLCCSIISFTVVNAARRFSRHLVAPLLKNARCSPTS